MSTHIDLSATVRNEVTELLNTILANEFILYIKTLKFHWNIESSDFAALHLFLEKQYEQLLGISDDVAERVRALGKKAYGTCEEFLEHATVTEEPGINPDDQAMLALLCKDHETLIRQLRAAIVTITTLKDDGTANFLTELMEKHEKMAWMLRSFAPSE
jgi:starvation-inducible DNA-binding protein